MNNTPRVLQNKHLPWSEALHDHSESVPTRISPERDLSFLSLREAVNGYPDTGESGDTYDVEVTTKS